MFKDKNGVELKEGDVVFFLGTKSKQKPILVVENECLRDFGTGFVVPLREIKNLKDYAKFRTISGDV